MPNLMVSALIEVENIIATPNLFYLKKIPGWKKKKKKKILSLSFLFLFSSLPLSLLIREQMEATLLSQVKFLHTIWTKTQNKKCNKTTKYNLSHKLIKTEPPPPTPQKKSSLLSQWLLTATKYNLNKTQTENAMKS